MADAFSVTSPTRAPLIDQFAQQQMAAQRLRWRENPRAKPFIPSVDKISMQTGVPADLMGSLLERESQFNPNAVSPAGAVGIAQLMPVHHKQVNPRDPNAAIGYSAKYLQTLHKRFGDWEKALAAYNYGPTNVSKAIRTHGEGWKDALPTETKKYIGALAYTVRK